MDAARRRGDPVRRSRHPPAGAYAVDPKPLVEIGGEPIVWHVIQIYAAQGFRRFVLCTGYKGEQIEAFVPSHHWPDGVEVRCLDTGLDTPTGGRIRRGGPAARGSPFCAHLRRRGGRHRPRAPARATTVPTAGLATMTVVRPELQFGVAELNGDGRVRGFREKPRLEHWINGGFFCFEPGALDYIDDESSSSASRSSGLPPTGSSTRSGTRASGSAWTRTRTPCSSTTRGHAAAHPGGSGPDAIRLRHGRIRAARHRARRARCSTRRSRSRSCAATCARGRLWCSRVSRTRVNVVNGDVTDLAAAWSAPSASTTWTASSTSPRRRSSARRSARRWAPGRPISAGTWTMLEACRHHEVARVVVAASDKAYGAHDELPYREDLALRADASRTTSARRRPT